MITLDSITLPKQLRWSDEFDWSPVKQTLTPTLTGSLLVEENVTQIGRPITLLSEGGVWCPRSEVLALKAREAIPGQVMTLTLADGRQFQVTFRQDPVAVTATELFRVNNPQPTDIYELDIRLIVID